MTIVFGSGRRGVDAAAHVAALQKNGGPPPQPPGDSVCGGSTTSTLSRNSELHLACANKVFSLSEFPWVTERRREISPRRNPPDFPPIPRVVVMKRDLNDSDIDYGALCNCEQNRQVWPHRAVHSTQGPKGF